MSELIDQSEFQSRAARLVEAARKAGADACDAIAVTGVSSLSVDVREGKVEETERAEGDDVTLRVFVASVLRLSPPTVSMIRQVWLNGPSPWPGSRRKIPMPVLPIRIFS